MSSHHKNSRTIAGVEQFGADMSAVNKMINEHANGLHTHGEHYRALADLHKKLCEVTLAVSGEKELPWVAQSRGHPWPTRKQTGDLLPRAALGGQPLFRPGKYD